MQPHHTIRSGFLCILIFHTFMYSAIQNQSCHENQTVHILFQWIMSKTHICDLHPMVTNTATMWMRINLTALNLVSTRCHSWLSVPTQLSKSATNQIPKNKKLTSNCQYFLFFLVLFMELTYWKSMKTKLRVRLCENKHKTKSNIMQMHLKLPH